MLLCYFGESCFVHFSKEKCCMRGYATRGGSYFYCHCQRHRFGFGFGLVSASADSGSGSLSWTHSVQKRRHDPVPVPRRAKRPDRPPQTHDFSSSSSTVNNNKSSCACQSLFERQADSGMGNGARFLADQISSSHRLWPLWPVCRAVRCGWWVGGSLACSTHK